MTIAELEERMTISELEEVYSEKPVLTYAYLDKEMWEKKMTNAEWIQHNGWKFSDLSVQVFDMDNIDIYHKEVWIGRYHVAGCRPVNALLKWLEAPHKEKILTDKEKKYLSAVIKPFRARIVFITKRNISDLTEYIDIKTNSDETLLPRFGKESMYKGMKLNRHYKLEELGL